MVKFTFEPAAMELKVPVNVPAFRDAGTHNASNARHNPSGGTNR
jgi:hypothetical protein